VPEGPAYRAARQGVADAAVSAAAPLAIEHRLVAGSDAVAAVP
jgi:hypothetical protein